MIHTPPRKRDARANVIGLQIGQLLQHVGGRQARFEQIAAALPVKRVGQPEDVADAVLMLMANPFTTGSTIFVDGGGMIA